MLVEICNLAISLVCVLNSSSSIITEVLNAVSGVLVDRHSSLQKYLLVRVMVMLINTVDLCFIERNLSAKGEISCVTTKCSKKHVHILLNF